MTSAAETYPAAPADDYPVFVAGCVDAINAAFRRHRNPFCLPVLLFSDEGAWRTSAFKGSLGVAALTDAGLRERARIALLVPYTNTEPLDRLAVLFFEAGCPRGRLIVSWVAHQNGLRVGPWVADKEDTRVGCSGDLKARC